jgi:aryl-alcohol dehydrogenase-like predicted oxidoreductase
MVTNESDTFEIGDETIHRLGYGAMRITGENIIGRPDDEDAARELLQHVVDSGVDFIDTADSYGPGVSERLIRESGITDDAIVATKAGLLRNNDGSWLPHGDPDYIRNQALVSRDRLGVDSIDVLQYHRPDPDVPYEDSITAFAELKDEGLVDHVGVSNVSVDQLETARDHVEVVTVQNRYNVGNREHEPVLEACEEYDIGFMPYFPVGAGNLDDVGDTLDEIADAHDATRYQIALAWLLHHSDVTLPIPGTSSVDHLDENVTASHIDLSDDEYNRLTDN